MNMFHSVNATELSFCRVVFSIWEESLTGFPKTAEAPPLHPPAGSPPAPRLTRRANASLVVAAPSSGTLSLAAWTSGPVTFSRQLPA